MYHAVAEILRLPSLRRHRDNYYTVALAICHCVRGSKIELILAAVQEGVVPEVDLAPQLSVLVPGVIMQSSGVKPVPNSIT